MSIARAHVFVSGKVQGVSYRFWAAREAEQLGLCGWVRNLKDGRVEAVFEGAPVLVESMVSWCRQGPSAAIVTDVELKYEEPEGLKNFQIRR